MELTMLFKKRFSLSVTKAGIKSILGRNGLCNGFGHGNPNYPPPRKFTDRHIRFLKKIVNGRKTAELAELFRNKFGIQVTEEQISNLCKRRGLQNGVDCRFQKGHIPFNKGIKGIYYSGCEKGWFKKGHIPWDYMPVGSERLTKDGYLEIKVSDTATPVQRRWRAKHIVIWEKENGPLPKSRAVLFLDGDKTNIKLSNLMLISRKELAVLNHNKMLCEIKDFNKTSVGIARLKVLVAEQKRRTLKLSKRKSELVIVDNTGKRIFVKQDSKTKRFISVRETKHGFQRIRANLKSRKTAKEAQRDLIAYAFKRGWYRA
jgi:hypothetical protein